MSNIVPYFNSTVSSHFSRLRGLHAYNAAIRIVFFAGLLVIMWMFFSASTAYAQSEISNWAELHNIRANPSGIYVLTADLTPSSADYATVAGPGANGESGWLPISDFSGTFDGRGFTISGLTINRSGTNDVGLFATTTAGAVVKDLLLVEVQITGFNNTGALVGYNIGLVSGVGVIGGTVNGSTNTGGLIGANLGSSAKVSQSFSSASVTGSGNRIAGLVGLNISGATILDSYSIGSVSATGGNAAGGLVGENNGNLTSIERSYAGGSVSITEASGSLVGNQIDSATTINSYYDIEATGQSTGPGTALTTAQIRKASNFTGFDFSSDTPIWVIQSETNLSYPYLVGFAYDTPGADPAVNPIPGLILTPFGEGDGTENTPYEIVNWTQFHNARFRPDSFFTLMNDLTSETDGYTTFVKDGVTLVDAGRGWLPIANFGGTLNGNGNSIVGLDINRPDRTNTGLFSDILASGSVSNLTVLAPSIKGATSTGALTGQLAGTLSQIAIEGGQVEGTVSVGGLVGSTVSGALLQNSYSLAVLSGDGTVGGLIGFNATGATVQFAYAAGEVNATGIEHIGGFIGQVENPNDITASFHDAVATQQPTTLFAVNPWELRARSLFERSGWDLIGETENGTADVWNIGIGTTVTYPYLNAMPPTPLPGTLEITYGGGDGSTETPYTIANWNHLFNVRYNPDSHFQLTSTLTTESDGYSDRVFDGTGLANEGVGWIPIGRDVLPFTGTFNGDGQVINRLRIEREANATTVANYSGLFGMLEGATVTQLRLVEFEIKVDLADSNNQDFINNARYTGSLAGRATQNSTISLISVDSLVVALVRGSSETGGLIGSVESGTTVDRVSVRVPMQGNQTTGGIVGTILPGASISNVITGGTITRLSPSTKESLAAFAASIQDASITNSLSYGSVLYAGTSAPNNRGFLASESGNNVFEGNFFDRSTSNQFFSLGAIPQLEGDVKTPELFTAAGWSISPSGIHSSVWEVLDETVEEERYVSFPYLKELPPAAGEQPGRRKVFTLSVIVDGGMANEVNILPNRTAFIVPAEGATAEVVMLTPVPANSLFFDTWTGDLDGRVSPATLTMDGNKSVTAVFKASSCPGGMAGFGSTDNPCQVATASHLDAIGNESLPGYDVRFLGFNYIQITDIDMISLAPSWSPIGRGSPEDEETPLAFRGVYDGQNFLIRNFQPANSTGATDYGFFGHIRGAEIRNIRFIGADVFNNNASTDGGRTGVMVGSTGCIECTNEGVTVLSNISIQGTVGAINEDVGGIIGLAALNTEISNVGFRGSVSGTVNVGGLVGRMAENASLRRGYAVADIVAEDHAGVLVGQTSLFPQTIEEMYAAGLVTASVPTANKGIIGRISSPLNTFRDIYYDEDITVEFSTSDLVGVRENVRGLATAAMLGNVVTEFQTGRANVDNWDFETTWLTMPGAEPDYPRLEWELGALVEITGFVRNALGVPLTGVVVTAVSIDPLVPSFTATSNSSGEYTLSFRQVPVERIFARSVDRLSRQTGAFVDAPSTNTSLDLELRTRSLTISSAPSANIIVEPGESGGQPRNTVYAVGENAVLNTNELRDALIVGRLNLTAGNNIRIESNVDVQVGSRVRALRLDAGRDILFNSPEFNVGGIGNGSVDIELFALERVVLAENVQVGNDGRNVGLLHRAPVLVQETGSKLVMTRTALFDGNIVNNVVLSAPGNQFGNRLRVIRAKDVDISYNGNLQLGSVTDVTGTITVATTGGNLSLLDDISTTNATDQAIRLIADAEVAAGERTGGNILLNIVFLNSDRSVTTGEGGRVLLYSGSLNGTEALVQRLGTSAIRFDLNSISDISALDPAMPDAGKFVLLREVFPFAAGEGTLEVPFEIGNWNQLNAVRYYLSDAFRLTEGITSASVGYNEFVGSGPSLANNNRGWQPIGTRETPFTGFFDGGGFFILDLKINRALENQVGLFGAIDRAVGTELAVRGLGMLNADVRGREDTGGLVGYLKSGTIEQSYVQGNVRGTTRVGGFAGQIDENGFVNNSYTLTEVIAQSPSSAHFVGVLFGTIDRVYAGLETFRTSEPAPVRGLVGRRTETGKTDGTVIASYWDEIALRTNDSAGGDEALPRSNRAMKSVNNYVNFDDSEALDNWDMSPLLAGETDSVGTSIWKIVSPNFDTPGIDPDFENLVRSYPYLRTNNPGAGTKPGQVELPRVTFQTSNNTPLMQTVTFSANQSALGGDTYESEGSLLEFSPGGNTTLDKTFLFDLGVVVSLSADEPAQPGSEEDPKFNLFTGYSSGSDTGRFNLNTTYTIFQDIVITASYDRSICGGIEVMVGIGTQRFPCEVQTVEHVGLINQSVVPGSGLNIHMGFHFKQMADLNFSSTPNFVPIGTNSDGSRRAFSGSWNGQEHVIRNLTIDRPNENQVGFIGRMEGNNVSLSNIRLENVQIHGNNFVGGLAGSFENTSTTERGAVENILVQGTVIAEREPVGGIFGFAKNAAMADRIAFIGEIDGRVKESGDEVGIGGLVGRPDNVNLQDSYVRASLTGKNAGGLFGTSTAMGVNVSRSFTAIRNFSNIHREEEVSGGAIIGKSLSSFDRFNSLNSTVYWDKNLTLEPTSGEFPAEAAYQGINTNQMRGANALSFMSGLDFNREDSPWRTVVVPFDGYPVFDFQLGDLITLTGATTVGGETAEGILVRTLSIEGVSPEGAVASGSDGSFALTVFRLPTQAVYATRFTETGNILEGGIIEGPFSGGMPKMLLTPQEAARRGLDRIQDETPQTINVGTLILAAQSLTIGTSGTTGMVFDGERWLTVGPGAHFNEEKFVREITIRDTEIITGGNIDYTTNILTGSILFDKAFTRLVRLRSGATISMKSGSSLSVSGPGSFSLELDANINITQQTSVGKWQLTGNLNTISGGFTQLDGANNFIAGTVSGISETGYLLRTQDNFVYGKSSPGYTVENRLRLGKIEAGGRIRIATTRSDIVVTDSLTAGNDIPGSNDAAIEILPDDGLDSGVITGAQLRIQGNAKITVNANQTARLFTGGFGDSESPVRFLLDIEEPISDPISFPNLVYGIGADNRTTLGTGDLNKFDGIFVALRAPFPFAGGSGTPSEPYQITTWEHLHNMRVITDQNYKLMNSLGSSDTNYDFFAENNTENPLGWRPVGSEEFPFRGGFDGSGHEISGLEINRPNENNVGLFGVVASPDAIIQNIGLRPAMVRGSNRTGGLVGHLRQGTVRLSYVDTGNSSFASVPFNAGSDAGGFAGLVEEGGTIEDSYAFIRVQGNSGLRTGGFAGRVEGGTLNRVWSAGTVTSTTGGPSGGIIGSGSGSILNSFWDTESSGTTRSGAGTGLSTFKMQSLATYANTDTKGLTTAWDITETIDPVNTTPIWQLFNLASYPYLREVKSVDTGIQRPGFNPAARFFNVPSGDWNDDAHWTNQGCTDLTTDDTGTVPESGQVVICDGRNATLNTTFSGPDPSTATLTVRGGASLTIANNGLLTLQNNARLNLINDRTLDAATDAPGGKLIVESGGGLVLDSLNSSTFTRTHIESSALLRVESGGQALTRGQVNGPIHYQQLLEAPNQWYALSNPIRNGVFASQRNSNTAALLGRIFTSGFPGADDSTAVTTSANVLFYDETSSGTRDARFTPPGSNDIPLGRGFFVYGSAFKSISGQLETVDYTKPFDVAGNSPGIPSVGFTFPLTYSADAANSPDDGWNLMGNPFGAALNWADGSWTKTNLNGFLYLYNAETGGYLVSDGAGNTADIEGVLTPPVIAPFQAFWVKAMDSDPVLKAETAAQVIDFSNDGLVGKAPSMSRMLPSARETESLSTNEADAQPDASQAISIDHSPNARLILRMKAGGYPSATVIRLGEEYTTTISPRDAFFLTPMRNEFAWLHTVKDDAALLIHSLPDTLDTTLRIPLHAGIHGLSGENDHQAELHWELDPHLTQNYTIRLIDMHTGKPTFLQQNGSLSFALQASTAKSPAETDLRLAPSPVMALDGRAPRFMIEIISGTPTDLPTGDLPMEFSLSQNFPNPFNPSTTIRYTLPEAVPVRVEVFNILGQRVATLVNEPLQEAGYYAVTFDGQRLASGVYMYRIQAGSYTQTHKMTLIK